MSIERIGRALAEAGGLVTAPLIVYGSKEPPEGGEPLAAMDRCVGKAIYTMAVREMPPGYISLSARAGCCPGGQAWLGLSSFPERLKYFVSTGTPEFMGGRAEYLKRCPEMVEESVQTIGEITMPAENIIIQRTEGMTSEIDGLCIILFGRAENIRNLCSLQHFGTTQALTSILSPWGPICASLVTYASGMASNIPCDSVILGPTDPTGNQWFPPDMMSLSIPLHVACRMEGDLKQSFIKKHPETAFPSDRHVID
jgi:hypothetical protein